MSRTTAPGSRRAPRPTGPLSGRRTPLRRLFASLMAWVNRGLDRLVVGHWLHRLVQRQLTLTDLQLPLRPGHEGLDGLRLAFVSDVHAGSFLGEQDLVQIFRRIAAAEPDLVLFGGDLINTRDREILLFKRAFAELHPRYGMFAVPGNHDHFYGPDISLWRAFLEQCGVRVLMNDGARIEHGGASLWLCGVDDLTEGQPDLPRALAGRRGGEPAVLLAHHPDFFFEAAAVDVDLQLSGHTHGGQIRIAGKAPIHHSRFGYERGWFTENGSRLYVGRGVGVTLLPIRIDAAPEVPMVTLRKVAAPTAPRIRSGGVNAVSDS
ncbi:MAG: metallophosphoesterase [Planctomycetes bacterium]|nr:metallophosphoesterase [Planctomycetota bacterium]